jgi:hypothetical protein
MQTKYTGKLNIGNWTSPLDINFISNFCGSPKLNDTNIVDEAMEYLMKDNLDEIPNVKLTIFKNGKKLKAINIV